MWDGGRSPAGLVPVSFPPTCQGSFLCCGREWGIQPENSGGLLGYLHPFKIRNLLGPEEDASSPAVPVGQGGWGGEVREALLWLPIGGRVFQLSAFHSGHSNPT